MSTRTRVQPKSNSSLNLQEHELIRALTSGDKFLTPKKRSDEHESFTSEETLYFSRSLSGPILDWILGPVWGRSWVRFWTPISASYRALPGPKSDHIRIRSPRLADPEIRQVLWVSSLWSIAPKRIRFGLSTRGC